MPAYAVEADLTAYLTDLGVTNAPTDPAAIARLLERASRDVDAVIGPLAVQTTGTYAGLKLDPTTLEPWAAAALARATCAQAEHRLRHPEALTGERTASSIEGPDFKVTYANGATGGGRYSAIMRDELATLGLPRRTARLGR